MRIPCFLKPQSLEGAYVAAIVELRKLNLYGTVEFLVDTGAARTTISEKDAIRMGMDYAVLEKLDEGMLGAGGAVDTYLLKDAVIIFRTADRQGRQGQLERLCVIKHSQSNEKLLRIPSVLGRDILNKYVLVYDKQYVKAYLTNERTP